ncbi:Cholinesterase [Arthrobotrys entomopaga]|nr:Cholinesterase [Arthrobotrys entomopaga]
MKSPFVLTLVITITLQLTASALAFPPNHKPSAQARNGTIYGIYSPEHHQDYFLGIPYAQPPVGNLRFRPPQSLNKKTTVHANAYGNWCWGPAGTTDFPTQSMAEDCLTLNIVRPANTKPGAKLPVAFWIHGGGHTGGSAADRRYNLTYLVEQSVAMGNPIIGVSINYRLSIWGWLSSRQVLDSGNTNLGLRDQRMAMRWVQENIHAFGGDRSRVTVFGESAGAISISWHMLAYGGRDDGLFSGAVIQSGSAMWDPLWQAGTWQENYNTLLNQTGCASAADGLECLRGVDNSLLWQFAQVNGLVVVATVDGDIFEKSRTSQLVEEGKFVRVPTIIGTNTDEGTAFGPYGDTAANTTAELRDRIATMMSSHLTNPMIDELLTLYGPSASDPDPSNYTGIAIPYDFLGTEFFRGAAMFGDWAVHAPKRFTAQQYAAHNTPVWTYRFNCIPYQYPGYVAATHFAEVAFVFYNRYQDFGDGFSKVNPMGGPERELYIKLSDFMSRRWINFFNFGNPNGRRGRCADGGVYWPGYGEGHRRQQIVFDKGVGNTFVERDNYRAEGMEWMIEHMAIAGR